jgi:hypothetical protein
VLTLQLRSRADKAAVNAAVGRRASAADYGVLLTGRLVDVTVFKPNGMRLLTVLRGAISEEAADKAYPWLHSLKRHVTRNRGVFSGAPRFFRVKKNGERSNKSETLPIRSCVVGHFDRYPPRFPYCNTSPIIVNDPTGWETFKPMAQEAGRLLAQHVPDRFAAQAAQAAKTHPAYVVHDSPFTTMTVNNTHAGGYHRDGGDLKEGFGVMAVLRRGSYKGCHLVVPAYGVGVDLGDRDLILFDVHEVHGNTPFEDAVAPEASPEGHERISIVFYYRERMVECLEPSEELARAQRLRGDPSAPHPARKEDGDE